MKKIAGIFWGVCLMFMLAMLPVRAESNEFTTFEELKALAAGSYDSNTSVNYSGEEELVILESLEIPENLSITFYKNVIIPEGVTLTTNENVTFIYGLEVAGTLHIVDEYVLVNDELTITGNLLNDAELMIACPDNVTGIENAQCGEGSTITWQYSVQDAETVKQVAERAGNDTDLSARYECNWMNFSEVVMDENLTIPENMMVIAFSDAVVEENCVVDSKGKFYFLGLVEVMGTLTNEGEMAIQSGKDLCVTGTFNNTGVVYIYGGSMTLTNEGEYTGDGVIQIYGVEEAAIASAVPGLDLAKFQITDGNGYWELRIKSDEVNPIESFVTRMYEQCLSRDPDQAGLDGWVGQLENGNMNGAQIAEQFVFSNEMLEKNLSNEEFVNVLYRSMMGREADAAGRTGWVNELNNGYLTRSEVTKCFVESTEFTGICDSYGIVRGDYDASIAPIEHFVTRFYTLCLERDADQKGLYGWVNNLKNKYMNGAQIADAFIFSDELVAKNVSNEKYVELLYNTLLGRASDANGKAGWMGELQGGHMDREDMMKAFIDSKEFGDICTSYGIDRGEVVLEKHSYETVIVKEATCGEAGLSREECSVCKAVKAGSEKEIPPTGEHILEYGQIAPCCVQSYCTNCDYSSYALISGSVEEMLGYINAERAYCGYGPLSLDSEMCSAAQTRAEQIVSDYSHNGNNTGYAENINMALSVADCYASWEDSSGHYANMVGGGYTRMGFAWASGPDAVYFVALFD